MFQHFRTPTAALLLLMISGCAGQQPPATTPAPAAPRLESTAAPPTAQPAPSASKSPPNTAPAPTTPVFSVAVIVDTQTQAVSREQASAAITDAAQLLGELTPITLIMVDYLQDNEGGSTGDMAARYINTLAAAPPNGLVVFSNGDAGNAKSSGGYSFGLAVPDPFRNAFVSPLMGDKHIYVAVVDFGHKYAPCGYGGAESIQSTFALAGECGNQTGATCVQANGYSMCASASDDLYASSGMRYTVSLIIRELLMAFTQHGAQDDYGSAECNARMGYPAGFRDLQESQYHSDLCPSVYEAFVSGYQP